MTLFRRPSNRIRTRHQNLQRSSHVDNEGRSESNLDKWLQRLSHLSQFGLFLFTIGTIYFTVIPLYQKSLLDEAIAKKEIELKQATELLDKAYRRLRAGAVKDYSLYIGPSCSGLLIPRANVPRVSGSPKSIKDTPLGIDVHACMLQGLKETSSLTELQAGDRSKFEAAVQELGMQLKNLQSVAVLQYQGVLKIATTDPDNLPVPQLGEYEKQAQEDIQRFYVVLNKLGAGESAAAKRTREIQFATSHEQYRIAHEYQKEVLNRISNLRDFKWEK